VTYKLNYTQKKSSCEVNYTPTIDKSSNYVNTDKKSSKKQSGRSCASPEVSSALLFSYSITPDKDIKLYKIEDTYNYISYLKSSFSDIVMNKYTNTNDYINNIFIKSKINNQINQLDYKKVQEYKIKDDINYKNSYVKYAYETIDNPASIFVTNTLDSNYHPFFKKGTILNPILENSNDIKETFDKMVFDGYVKLEEAREDFYKSRLFRQGGLIKESRALILAIEPHKTFIPHTHKLEVINRDYMKEYVSKTIDNHIKHKLGRTEIAIFEKDFNNVKNDYELTFNDGLYFINKHIYFKVLEQKSDTEIQSISNYMTKYIEQSYIIDDKEKDKKKSPIIYSAFAYYIASLKDKYAPKKDGTKYKKIRRIRYARLLISKKIYQSIMTKELIDYLKNIEKYHKQNMYLHITKLLNSKDLEIYRYYKIDNETGEIFKNKVYYYEVKIGEFYQKIDEMLNEVYKYDYTGGQKKKISLYSNNKIDLFTQSHYVDKYNTKESECFIIDTDVLINTK